MKVVINKCFGGFSLSYAGVMEYARRKKMKLYAYHNARDYNNDIRFGEYIPWDGVGREPLLLFYSTAPAVDGKLDDNALFSDRDIPRDDPALVATVKALGAKASGSLANLKIVTIPDGTDWEISEYDGLEHVAQKHKTWG